MSRVMRNRSVVRHMVQSGIVKNQKDLGKKMGYNNESAFSQVINERVAEPKDFIVKLKNILPTLNENWLKTGEGEMIVKPIGITPHITSGSATSHIVRVVVPSEEKVVMPKRNALNALKYAKRGKSKLVTPNPDGTVTIESVEQTTTPIPIAPLQANIDTGQTSPNENKEPISAENAEVIELIREEVRAELQEEIREEIKQEEAIPVISREIANTPNTDIKKYVKDNSDELKRIYVNDLTQGAKVAECVESTSMWPTFQPGDWVFVKFIDKDSIIDGKTYYFDLKTLPTMIRKVKIEGNKLRLMAKNPTFGDIVIDHSEVNNIAKIVGMFRSYFGDQYDEIEEVRRKKDEQIDKFIDQNKEALSIIKNLIEKK